MVAKLQDPLWRRTGYLVLLIVFALLAIFPRPFVARAKLLPQDSNSAGLGQIVNSLGGQLSTFANLLTGGRPPNDLYLIIGRSDTVTKEVIGTLKLVGPSGPYSNDRDAKLALKKDVDVHLLLGGVVEVESTTTDPDRSMALTQAYTDAISRQISELTRQTTKRKAAIVQQRYREAGLRVTETEHALDAFRKVNRLASPELQLGAQLSLRTQLQAQLQAKQVALQAERQTAGPENPALATLSAQIATLRGQLADTERPGTGEGGPNIAGLSDISSQYLNLFRDYKFAQALYDVYLRATEQVAVESLVAESASFIQLVEPANIDPQRHYNVWAVAMLALVVLAALFTEFYVPATGLSRRVPAETNHAEDIPLR